MPCCFLRYPVLCSQVIRIFMAYSFIYFLGADRLGGHLKFTLLLAGILYHDQESRPELIVAFVLRWEKVISRLGV